MPATDVTLWKLIGADSLEVTSYELLMDDATIRPFVPQFFRTECKVDETFIEIANLCRLFRRPSMMDVKMGSRTFLEAEVENKKLRPDLYDKLVELDANEPTADESELKAITKLR